MKKLLKSLLLFILLFPLTVFGAVKDDLDSLSSKIDNFKNSQFLNNHPVGSIYMTTSSDENTVDKLKAKYGGTWEVYAAGRIIMGYDSSNSSFNTIEKTGGNYTTTLSTNNMPSHTHSISHTHTTPEVSTGSGGAHTHSTASKELSFSLTLNSNGAHTHGWTNGGYIVVITDQNANSPTVVDRTMGFANTSSPESWWPGMKKNKSALSSAGAHTHTVSGSITIPALSIGSSGSHTHSVASRITSAASTGNSGATGSNAAFSNLSPYVVVYTYKRIS